MINKRHLLGVFCFVLLLSQGFAVTKEALEPSGIAVGADVMGRGGAYLGSVSGNPYVFQNYAQTTDRPVVTAMSTKLLDEFTYTVFSFSLPNWSFGYFGMTNFGGYERDAFNNVGDKLEYADHNVYGAYAFTYERYRFGLRGKYIRKNIDALRESGTGFALDVGAAYQFQEGLNLGAEITNVGFGGMKWSTGEYEKFPQTLGLGLQLELFGPHSLLEYTEIKTNLFSDVRFASRGATLHFGGEVWPADFLVLRAGIGEEFASLDDNEPGKEQRLSLGVGLVMFDFAFDYAYCPDTDVTDMLTHYFMLSYRLPSFAPATTSSIAAAPLAAAESPLAIEAVPVTIATTEEQNVTTTAVAEAQSATYAPLSATRWVSFSDLQGHPYRQTIEALATLGLLNGYADGTYRPGQYITRRELTVLLVRMLEKQGVALESEQRVKLFADLDYAVDTYGPELQTAAEVRVLRGYPDGSAKVLRYTSRAEGTCLFERYNRIAGEPTLNYAEQFADISATHWGAETIFDSRAQGLVNGMGDNLFRPKYWLRRGDAALILSRTVYVRDLLNRYQTDLDRLYNETLLAH